MAALNDTALLWQEEIYQLETNDPVIGGTPNESTGAGMDNIPHLQLARRTRFLKEAMDAAGLGATDSPLVTLNTAFRNGSYRFAAGDPNTPATGIAGTVLVTAAASDAVNQVALQSGGTRMWTRFWNGVVWSAWSEIWQAPGVTASLTANGWSRQPNGQLDQWGAVTSDAAGQALVTFPQAFASNQYNIVANHAGTGAAMVIEDMSLARTATQIRLRCFNHENVTQPGWIIRWRATGW